MKITSGTHQADSDGIDLGRRNVLRLAGLGVATLGMMPLVNLSIAKA